MILHYQLCLNNIIIIYRSSVDKIKVVWGLYSNNAIINYD